MTDLAPAEAAPQDIDPAMQQIEGIQQTDSGLLIAGEHAAVQAARETFAQPGERDLPPVDEQTKAEIEDAARGVEPGNELLVVNSGRALKETGGSYSEGSREHQSVTTERKGNSDPALKEAVKPLNVIHLKEAIDTQAQKELGELTKGGDIKYDIRDKDGSQAETRQNTIERIKSELVEDYLQTGSENKDRKVPATVRAQLDEMLKMSYSELEAKIEQPTKKARTPKAPQTDKVAPEKQEPTVEEEVTTEPESETPQGPDLSTAKRREEAKQGWFYDDGEPMPRGASVFDRPKPSEAPNRSSASTGSEATDFTGEYKPNELRAEKQEWKKMGRPDSAKSPNAPQVEKPEVASKETEASAETSPEVVEAKKWYQERLGKLPHVEARQAAEKLAKEEQRWMRIMEKSTREDGELRHPFIMDELKRVRAERSQAEAQLAEAKAEREKDLPEITVKLRESAKNRVEKIKNMRTAWRERRVVDTAEETIEDLKRQEGFWREQGIEGSPLPGEAIENLSDQRADELAKVLRVRQGR